VYCDLLNSTAWSVLGYAARSLFLDLRASVTSTNNGNISATLKDLKHRGWTSSATLANALYELQALGFLVKTRGGGVETGSKVCNLYAFTDLEVFEVPRLGLTARKASHAYLRFKTKAEAEAAVAEFMKTTRESVTKRRGETGAGKKTTLQKLNEIASENERVERFDASDFERDGSPSLQKLNETKRGAKHAETVAA
jgi:hypothetical protein